MKAKVQARVYSAPKVKLETVVPLDTPFSVHIDICSLCNFKCKFCFQSDDAAIREKKLKRGFMDMALYKKIVDSFTGFKHKFKKVKIGLHGEPTMHPDLPEMIAYLKAKNVTEIIELFTNGSLLNPVLSKKIIDAGLNRINISVEGLTSDKYLEVTGVPVNMEEFVRNVKGLYDVRKDCRIYIKIVDAGLSEKDKEKFFELFGDICDEIFIENIVPQWAETNKFELGVTGMYGQKVTKYKHVCPFLFMYLHYNHDGTVSGCTLDWAREVLIGDGNKEGAVDIWNGDRLRALQIAHLEKKRDKIAFCSKCMAPMICCMEDLDDCAEELLKKIKK
ncbi:MAG TPA: radical SAM protein [Candidatus Omnitrophota bacterium]|nr:radical SAM protein [Candidatus Omnitrophota bacterium]